MERILHPSRVTKVIPQKKVNLKLTNSLCQECIRLYREFAEAASTQYMLQHKLETAVSQGNAEAVAGLIASIAEAKELRQKAQDAAEKHTAESHCR